MGLKSMKIYFGAGKRSNSYTTNIILNATIFQKLAKLFWNLYLILKMNTVCDRIEILTEPEPDHRIGIILAGTGPEPDRITSQKKLPDSTGLARSTGLAGFLPDFLNFNTQLTSHKNKYGSFNFDI